MRYLPNGPDIPFELIKALKADKLVFFCGAGVSALPEKPEFGSFKELFAAVVKQLNYKDESIFELYKSSPESAFEYLEQTRGKKTVDDCIRGLLKLDEAHDEKLLQHDTILRLSSSTERPIPRLVTTNFDNCFDRAWQNQCALVHHSADAIPVPSKTWSSIVHLHGKADIASSELVYSRTGFAKAYIGQGWASSFLMDLFRAYTVVYIGYSLRDPLMGYAVQTQDPKRQPYIFISEDESKDEQNALRGLNIAPITYGDHDGLWESLKWWADMHEQGRDGWVAYARAELWNAFPTGEEMSSESVVAIKNLTELLSDPHIATALLRSGLPIQWLDTFVRIDNEPTKYNYFNVLQPNNESNPACSYGRIVNPDTDSRPLHPVTREIGIWMANNIEYLSVLDYIVENGGIIHPELSWYFNKKYKEQTKQALMSSAQVESWELILYNMEPSFSRGRLAFFEEFELSEGTLKNGKILFLLELLRPRLTVKNKPEELRRHGSAGGLFDIDIKVSSYYERLRAIGLLVKLQEQAPIVLKSLFFALESHLQKVVLLSSLFQDEEALNLRQNRRSKSGTSDSNDWTILLKWVWAAFEQLSSAEKQKWIEYWSQSHSLLIRRMALQGFNRMKEAQNDS